MFTIAVIGAGVLGLPTALEIQKTFGSKANVTIFTEQLSPNTTGDIAAGLIFPYLLGNTPLEKIIQWSQATQNYVLDLWKDGKAKEMGISLQTVVILSTDQKSEIPHWRDVILGYSEMTRQQLEEYNQKCNDRFTNGIIFSGFVWEASKFLPQMERNFLQNGGQIVEKTIKNFEELSSFDVIVNCTGLKSRILVPDSSVRPIRGQVARVYAPWQYHTFIFESQNSKYIIANHDCVILGGTSQTDNFNTSTDENDKKEILEACFKYTPALVVAPVIQHQVGLRPGRDSVRLQIEHRRSGDKILKIVHNYGHGGSGVTLCVGCAKEAAHLVKEALQISQSKL